MCIVSALVTGVISFLILCGSAFKINSLESMSGATLWTILFCIGLVGIFVALGLLLHGIFIWCRFRLGG